MLLSRSLFIVVTGWFIFSASSCLQFTSYHGHLLDEEKISLIEVGLSTRPQVVSILGSPTVVSTFNLNTWYYIGQRTNQLSVLNPSTVEALILTIQFDDTDRVESISQLDEQAIKDVAFVDRETLTQGRTFSIFEQLFSTLVLGIER